jgi:LemA protein
MVRAPVAPALMKKFLLLALAAVFVLGLIVVLLMLGQYNGLVDKRAAVDASWAQVQNVYQRRADLVPNLVATVKGAANFERETLTAVTEARASVGRVNINATEAPRDAAQFQEFARSQGQLSSALSRLLVVSENYPQLRATEGFLTLQSQLEGSENRITVRLTTRRLRKCLRSSSRRRWALRRSLIFKLKRPRKACRRCSFERRELRRSISALGSSDRFSD